MLLEHHDLLQMNLYMITSNYTNKVYIDSQRNVYAFESKADAENFIEGMDAVSVRDGNVFSRFTLMTTMFAYGVKYIKVMPLNQEKFTDIPVEVVKKDKKYHNPEANYHVLFFRQNQNNPRVMQQEMIALYDKEFIIPTRIEQADLKTCPNIRYSTVNTGDKIFYCLFSDLKSFNYWNDNIQGGFQPVQTTFEKLYGLRRDSGVVINPLTEKVIITGEQLDAIGKYVERSKINGDRR